MGWRELIPIECLSLIPAGYPMLIPTGYLSLEACVHRVASHRNPVAATQLDAARADHKAVEPILAEIAGIQELKRSVKKPAPIPIGPRARMIAAKNELYREHQERVRAISVPRLSPDQLQVQERLRAAEARYLPIYKDAESFLRQSFGDSRLPTFCLRFSDGELETIPPPRWWTRAGDDAFTSGLWRAIGRVLVREADLEALLVPQNGSSPAPTELTPADQSSCNSQSDGGTLPPASTQAGTALPITNRPLSERRPSYSPDALRAWFVLRVRTWPEDAPFPTEAQDLAAARNSFEGRISRDPFRDIRRAKTPASWRESGPRRTRG
jgi:hypothetical protein